MDSIAATVTPWCGPLHRVVPRALWLVASHVRSTAIGLAALEIYEPEATVVRRMFAVRVSGAADLAVERVKTWRSGQEAANR